MRVASSSIFTGSHGYYPDFGVSHTTADIQRNHAAKKSGKTKRALDFAARWK